MSDEIIRAKGTANDFALKPNDAGDPAAPWTDRQDEILNDAAFMTACETICSWPGYAQTPLLALPGRASALGIAAVFYKDEGGRFGLGSFKALGGAYAVARLLQRQVEETVGRPRSEEHTSELQSP